MSNANHKAPSEKTEVTFFRIVACDPGEKRSSYMEDLERWESDNQQYLMVAEDYIDDSELTDPISCLPF